MKTVMFRASAIVAGALFLAVLATSFSAPGQSLESMGFIHNSVAREQEARKAREAREKAEAKRTNHLARAAALNNPDNYRVVAGQLYNTAFSTNWVTLPEMSHRGKFLRMTSDGAAFEIEVVHDRLVGAPSQFDRVIIIRNYPRLEKVTGQPMKRVRALPVGTSTFFKVPAAIYDCGTPPGANPSAEAVASGRVEKDKAKADGF